MLETTATNLSRLINCNGSASMAVFSAAIDNADNSLRDEGIAAHHMAVKTKYFPSDESLIGKQAPNGIFMTEEMLASVDIYLDYITERNNQPFYFSEMEVDTSYQNGEFFRVNGRADNLHHDCNNVLFVDDFKYGFGIIEPEMNWTLISHAIGYCAQRPNYQMPDKFVFSIVQPRATHVDGIIRTWEIDTLKFIELWQFLIDNLLNLTDQLNTGDHCKRCPSLAFCPAATNAGFNAIDVSETVIKQDMSNKDLSYTLDLLYNAKKKLQYKLDALEELALHKVKSGEVVENYTSENSLGNTTWQGHVTPELVQTLTGIDIRSGKTITPNQAIKKGVPKNIVDGMTHRPNRGVKLKRTSADDKANKMFSTLKGEQNGD